MEVFSMRVYFDKRLSAWLDRFAIRDESGEVLFKVKGVMAMAQKFLLLDAEEKEIGAVKETLNLGTQFNLIHNNEKIGSVKKKGFFGSYFEVNYKDWQLQGDTIPWSYRIVTADGQPVAVLSRTFQAEKESYGMEVTNAEDLIPAVMIILAADSDRCTSGRRDMKKEIRDTLEKEKEERRTAKKGR